MRVCKLRYPAWNAHVTFCHLWHVRLYYIYIFFFFALSHKGTIFEGKLLNIKCMFWFSLQLLSETCLILRRTERDMIEKIYNGLRVKYPIFLSDYNATRIFSTAFRKKKKVKYQMSWKSVQVEPSCSMRTQGRTDGHETKNPFSQFC